jgi:hypothetical protein
MTSSSTETNHNHQHLLLLLFPPGTAAAAHHQQHENDHHHHDDPQQLAWLNDLEFMNAVVLLSWCCFSSCWKSHGELDFFYWRFGALKDLEAF